MKVDEIISFDQYWADPRFIRKKAVMNGSVVQRYGDNIYHTNHSNGCIIQDDSFHSEPNGVVSIPNRNRDTGTTHNVLIGKEFAYWGRLAPKIPDSLADFVHKTQGHKNQFASDRIEALLSWLASMPDRGYLGEPIHWN